MKILGIETSCDETAVAIVDGDKNILAHEILSQQEHLAFGGVVPEVAARAHLSHIDTLTRAALEQAQVSFSDLAAIAVTAGPGLIGGVMVGVMTAKAIAAVHNLPLIAVNHLEGHALTPRLTSDVTFPYLLLLVSGGHCQILIVEGVGAYKRLGTTIDDAAGEAFDKTAKLLGLGYPGGPALERAARDCKDHVVAAKTYPFPRSFKGRPGCDFSFSGLKTAARRAIDALPAGDIPYATACDIASSFQQTVVDILQDRMGNAIDAYLKLVPRNPTLVVAGGVAANTAVREMLQGLAARHGMIYHAPPMKLCTDNAAMIAWAGVERLRLGMTDPPDFAVRARWPLDPDAPIASPKSQKV